MADDGLGMRPRPDSPGVGLGMPLIADLADRVEIISSPGDGVRIAAHFLLMGAAGPHGRPLGRDQSRAAPNGRRPASSPLRRPPELRAVRCWANQSRAAPLERSKSAM